MNRGYSFGESSFSTRGKKVLLNNGIYFFISDRENYLSVFFFGSVFLCMLLNNNIDY